MKKIIDIAKEVFEEKGVAFPVIPEALKGSLKQISEHLFGTREDKVEAYNIEGFIDEIVSEEVKDYILLGFVEEEGCSWAVHYYIVEGPLAVFVQLKWNGCDEGNDEDVKRIIEGTFMGVEVLLESIRETKKKGLVEEGKRLVVVESNRIGSGWTWVTGLPHYVDLDKWNAEEPIYLGAVLSIPVVKVVKH